MADQRRRLFRYGRYTGGPDPLAPPPDLAHALDAVAEQVMAGTSPEQAVRELLRQGRPGHDGLDDLSRAVHRRRRDFLQRNRLDGTLAEVARLLDTALRAERGRLARDVDLDDDDRDFRTLRLDSLPASTAGAVADLATYDWVSPEAQQAYDEIRDLLGREALDQHFAGMKQALEGATDADRAAVSEMLDDLNALLAKHGQGLATAADFAAFMARHGAQFPEQPRTLDELVDVLARRAAAAQRLLRSMTADQRAELARLSAQAFGSPDLSARLAELGSRLRELRPDQDWSSSERFEGDEGLGLGEGTGVMQELADLDELGEQIGQSYDGAALDDIDLDLLGRRLGDEAVASARTLAELQRALDVSGLFRRLPDGSLRLSPQAVRRLGRALLRDVAAKLSGRSGGRDTRLAGAAGEQTGASREWHFGDSGAWDTTRTLSNAIRRLATTGRDPGDLRLAASDIEVVETETRTQAAVVLLVDISFSMAAEGRWVPMKRTALALHHLVSTRFRGDVLHLVAFGRYARSLDLGELTALPPLREQGTNLHHGLLEAARFHRRHPSLQPVLLVVTDGEPTAHLTSSGEARFTYPPESETLRLTVAELDRLGRAGVQVTFFRLGDDPGLERFVNRIARRIGGRVVAPHPDDLGAAVVGEYLRARERRTDRDPFDD